MSADKFLCRQGRENICLRRFIGSKTSKNGMVTKYVRPGQTGFCLNKD